MCNELKHCITKRNLYTVDSLLVSKESIQLVPCLGSSWYLNSHRITDVLEITANELEKNYNHVLKTDGKTKTGLLHVQKQLCLELSILLIHT